MKFWLNAAIIVVLVLTSPVSAQRTAMPSASTIPVAAPPAK